MSFDTLTAEQISLAIFVLVLCIGIVIAGYVTHLDTKRMNRTDPKPHTRANRDRRTP